jgi:sugar phosphate isomerase/epimerase
LREDAAKTIQNTIAYIAQAGYNNVELFGYNNRNYFGLSIPQMANLLKQHNLKSTSGHYGLEKYLFQSNEDELKQLIEDAHTLQHEYIVIPWLKEDQRRTITQYKQLAEKMNKAGEMCKTSGLKLAYHNHNFEFETKDENTGITGYETLLQETEPSLVNFEMDLYWVIYAEEQPIRFFEKYEKRFPLWHVKDMALVPEKHSVEVGKGIINFKELFSYRQQAGLQYFFVEQEAFTVEPRQAILTSYSYIKNI